MAAVNANVLRRLVEGADGIRGKDLFYEVRDEQLRSVPNRPESGEFVVVRTEFHGLGMRGTAKLGIQPPSEIPGKADAAFTTQSAFEKFVLPYYVRTRSIDELRLMLDRFYAPTVICAYHLPSSEIDTEDGTIFLLHANGDRELI